MVVAREYRSGCREQRGLTQCINLGGTDKAPLSMQIKTLPRSRPVGAENVAPVRQRVAAGLTFEARAVIRGSRLYPTCREIRHVCVRLGGVGDGIRALQVEDQLAERVHVVGVVEIDVHTLVLQQPGVLRQRRNESIIGQPQRTVGITVDQVAFRRIAGHRAIIDDRYTILGLDGAGDSDVVIVNRCREIWQEGWLEYEAVRPGVCLLRTEIRIAARLDIELTGRIHPQVSILRVRIDSRVRALRFGQRWRRAPTRIDAATRSYSLGGEQFANVRCAYRLGKAAAETDVLDRRPFD